MDQQNQNKQNNRVDSISWVLHIFDLILKTEKDANAYAYAL